MEFTCLLTSQLENQRTYFEMKLAEKEKQFQKARDSQQEKVSCQLSVVSLSLFLNCIQTNN